MLVQFTLEEFIEKYTDNEQKIKQQEVFNNKVNHMVEGVRDYIVTHYKVNSKSNSAYWDKCREHTNISSNLAELLNTWGDPELFEDALEKQQDSLAYLRPSWYVILAGMGLFTESAIQPNNDENNHIQAQKYCISVVNKLFPDHRQYLDNMSS